MVDDFLKDESKMSDIGAMRAMLEQLVEMVKLSQESIDKLTRTIEQQTQTIEEQTKSIELKDDRIRQLEQMLFG